MRTIVWDVDDVLNDCMRVWFENAWLPSHPDSPLISYERIVENPPNRVLGVGLDTYLDSLDRFRAEGGLNLLRPVPEVLSWFVEHGEGFRHVALTAVPMGAAPLLARWVIEHFGTWIRTFAFVPSTRTTDRHPAMYQDKEEYLRWLSRADYLVEDDEGNLERAGKMGIHRILVPRPWNGGRGSLPEALAALEAR